jgi:hypothetical protein
MCRGVIVKGCCTKKGHAYCQYPYIDIGESKKMKEWSRLQLNPTTGILSGNNAGYKKVNPISTPPKSLSDPRHFGHLAHRICEFMASLEEKGNAKSQQDKRM